MGLDGSPEKEMQRRKPFMKIMQSELYERENGTRAKLLKGLKRWYMLQHYVK